VCGMANRQNSDHFGFGFSHLISIPFEPQAVISISSQPGLA
jgi:hypothetical protein